MIYAPPNLPDKIVAKWTETLDAMKKDKAWNKMTKGLGSIPSIMPPAETKAFVKKQYETIKGIAEKVGLSVK